MKMNEDGQQERRLLPKSGDPRLFWLDEWFDTPSERAERERLKQENIKKWGTILSAADTFDDDIVPGKPSSRADASVKVLGLSGESFIVAASALVLLALAVNVLTSSSP